MESNVSGGPSQIQIEIHATQAEASNRVAERIAEAINHQPNCVLGLATGGTPVKAYQRLIAMCRAGEVDFSAVTTFNLDEYIGLSEEHSQSFRHFMDQHLFEHVNLRRESTFVPDGLAADIDLHCRQYEERIRHAGGIDLQLLGLGHNGHIAFNEPGSAVDSRTRLVDLTQETIEKNSRFFDSIDQVPTTAITMGIGTILESRKIVMAAFGDDKAEAVKKMIQGPVTESHPASFLQTHADVTVILDSGAASLL